MAYGTCSRRLRLPVAALALTLLALAGCASLPERPDFDADDQAAATVPGFENIRFYADDDGSNFRDHVVAQVMNQVAVNGMEILNHGSVNWLMISGGGEDGAYGAGVMVGLSKTGKRPDFDMVSGVSTGALMAPFVFLGPAYDKELKSIYTEIGRDQIFQIVGLRGIIGGAAAASSAPLRQTMEQKVTKRMLDQIAAEHKKGRRLYVVTTNLDAQRPVVWDMGAIAATPAPNRRKLFLDVLQASAAIPGVFPPVYITAIADGETFKEMHVDGGSTMQVLTLPSRIKATRDRRASLDKRKRALYILMNNTMQPRFEQTKARTFSIAGRSLSTIIKRHGIQSIEIMYDIAKSRGVAFYVTYVGRDFDKELPAPFDQDYMTALFDYGYQRALNGDVWRTRPPTGN
ncbi:patatin-like phospholipase family protein [Amorphus sp. 3PC139-8]|uniref:patatin-like phospholipase family protein n=1 Tax=Amorphus sp. 3PC139-8 TaxID=2735676 RepID=UPI00345DA5D5